MSFSDEGEAELQIRFWNEFPVALSDEQKKAIFYYARYSYTYAELEELLGVPASTISDWVALARMRIQEFLDNSENL